MTNIVIFDEKAVSEVIPLVVDFSDRLQAGESINGVAVSVSVFSGTDATPSAILSGAATYSGTQVTQKVTGGVAGVIYNIFFLVTGTNSHNYGKVGRLAVVSDTDAFA